MFAIKKIERTKTNCQKVINYFDKNYSIQSEILKMWVKIAAGNNFFTSEFFSSFFYLGKTGIYFTGKKYMNKQSITFIIYI